MERSLRNNATRLLRERQVLDLVSFSRSTLWRLVRAGEFPGPYKLSDGITVWRADEVYQWVETRTRPQAR